MKISWYETNNNPSSFAMGEENTSLLQIFVDSARHLNSNYRPYVEFSVKNHQQHTSSSLIKNEVAKYQTHFNFLIRAPEIDMLEVKVIDEMSTVTLGEYSYRISELLLRKKFEHQLQAFPLNSNHNFEILFALKLNRLRIPLETE